MRNMCWHEWVAFSVEYKKNKEFEDQVKASEKKVAEFMKDREHNAVGILSKISGATDSGLMHSCYTAWMQYYLDEKRSNEMAEKMNARKSKMIQFGDRNKRGAK